MSRNYTRNGILSLLFHIEEGAKKHASDPTFPDLSRICDVENERQLLIDALTKANAARAIWRNDAGAARAQLTQAGVLAQKLVHAITSWVGTRSDLLRDFGLTPHKEPAKRPRKPRASRRAPAHGAPASGSSGPSGPSGTTGASGSAEPPSSSSSGGSTPPEGSASPGK